MILLAVSVGISCNKDDDNNGGGGGSAPSATNTSRLCNKNWKMNSFKLNGIELLPALDSCALDDFTRFNTDNTYINDQGTIKCDTTLPQTDSGLWNWAAGETQLVTDTTDTVNILINSGTILKISPIDTSSGKIEITFGL